MIDYLEGEEVFDVVEDGFAFLDGVDDGGEIVVKDDLLGGWGRGVRE